MRTPVRPELMLRILEKIDKRGYAGAKEIEGVASRLRMPSSQVYGFISQFEELPQHPCRIRLRVCTGLACADAGAWAIYEELKQKAPGGVEVLADPGLSRWHSSPAVCVDVQGEGTGIAEGLTPDDIDRLAGDLESGRPPSFRPWRDVHPPLPRDLSGREASPWSQAAAEKGLPESWGPGMLSWASEHPEEIWKGIAEGPPPRPDKGAAAIVCDLAGPQGENSVSFASFQLFPRAVVAGCALAAAACGVRKVVFYLPWEEKELAGGLEKTAADLLSGSGIRYSVFRGPARLASAWDIGRAALVQGMMLWRAASLYGWEGTGDGGRPLVVLDAEDVWRVPWRAGGEPAQRQGQESGRMLCLAGGEGPPRLLEVSPGGSIAGILSDPGLAPEYGSAKAVHVARRSGAEVVPARNGEVKAEGAREVVVLDTLSCMPRWALYLSWDAERSCCGGCIPGRTAPAAAARLLRGILEPGAETGVLEGLGKLLEQASGLAMCPRLLEKLQPVKDCLLEFGEEFEEHSARGTCMAGSCEAAVEAGDQEGGR
ncbi:MAG: NAD(P)H-dependent oxidoreductase subunit E [Actinomycetota bacterium]